MVIYFRSDFYHLSTTNKIILTLGVNFLSDYKQESKYCKSFVPLMNGIIHVVCKILQNVMASDVEAELGSMFVNSQYVVPIRNKLIEINHPQPSNPIKVENSTAVVVSNEAL